MPVDVRHNLVTFRPDGGGYRVALTLDGDWSVIGGLRPAFNSARVKKSERDKLPANVTRMRGTVEFWFNAPPTNADLTPNDEEDEPDVVLQGIFLVDVSVGELGKAPGETLIAPQSFRLCFADHRIGFLDPVGGRLSQGLINPEPAPPGYAIQSNSALIAKCLTAMGAPSASPSSVDDVEPARQVEWFGAHAPSELARILEHCGHVYAVHSSGLGFIALPGFGNPPVIPPSRLSYSIASSNVDRRPAKAIFYSAPTAVVRTFEGSGPNAPEWQYVAQDHVDGRWKPIASIAALGGTSAQVNFNYRRGFTNVPEEWRKHYLGQVYKCVRLDTTKFPPASAPILRKLHRLGGSVEEPHLRATIARQFGDGSWVNVSGVIKASTIIASEGVLVFDEYLGTVSDGEKPDQSAYFLPLTEPAIKVNFSVEDWDQTNGQKRYATFGFNFGGTVAPMSESTAAAHLVGFRPDTAIYGAPELRLIRVNDVTDNKDDLQAIATGYAQRLLVSSALPPTSIEVTGYFPIELDGRVSEIRYSQSGCRTMITLDGWNIGFEEPSESPAEHELSDADAGRPTKQFSRRTRGARKRAERSQREDGGSTYTEPSTPTASEAPAPAGFRDIILQVTAPISGQLGRYSCKSISGKMNTAASGNLAIANFGAISAVDDVELWYAGDIGGTAPGALKAGDIIAALAGPVKPDGKILAIATSDKTKLKQKSVIVGVSCANNQLSVTSETIWVWDV